MISRTFLVGLTALALGATSALAAPTIDGEFPVPEIDSNDKIVQGPDGNMWLAVTEAGKDVVKITPTGAVTPYDLEAITSSGIAVGPEGRIWITRNGGVTTFEPGNPLGSKDPTDIAEIGTAHSIVRGPDNNMWVATNGKVLKLQASDPSKFTPYPVAGLEPKDIDAAGQLLVVADASGEPRIVTLTTAGAPATYKIPGASQGVAGAASGLIGFSQAGKAPEQVGLISPPTALPLIETPGGLGDPFGAALGVDDAFWFAMSANDGLARLTSSGQLTLLNGFAKGSFPRQLAPGPNNTLWVTLDMTEKVGRVSGLEPPVAAVTPTTPVPPPDTKITKGPKGAIPTTRKRAPVSFKFTSPSVGATFECRLKRLPGRKPPKKAANSKKASKAPAFRACKSPKVLKLRPGRYRFEVRAVLSGVVDPTPARRSFRVVRVFPIDK